MHSVSTVIYGNCSLLQDMLRDRDWLMDLNRLRLIASDPLWLRLRD